MTEVILDDKQACKFAALICAVYILTYVDTHKEEYESFLQKEKMEINNVIGDPFNFETSIKFDKATITFKVDKSKLGDTKFDNLLILWYDEENQTYKEMETEHNESASTVSTTTTHFSQYGVNGFILFADISSAECK